MTMTGNGARLMESYLLGVSKECVFYSSFLYAQHLIFACTAIFVPGGLAGLSMIWYRSSSIALYLASKISEVRMKEFLPLVFLPRL